MSGSARAVAVWLSVAALACGGASDRTAPTPVQPSPPGGGAVEAPIRLTVVTHTAGFRHDSIPAAEAALQQIAQASGVFTVRTVRTATEVVEALAPPALAATDAVFFVNTTGNIGVPDLQALADWVGAGHGFLGAHSAADTYHDAPAYLSLLGGEFIAHGAIVEAEVQVLDAANSIVGHMAPSFRIADEWYRLRMMGPPPQVLLRLPVAPADGAAPGTDLPLAWQKAHGSGRVFYTALGHRSEVWQEPRFRTHLLEAIRWAGGQRLRSRSASSANMPRP